MTTRQNVALLAFHALVVAVLATSCDRASAQTVKVPTDPGVRGGASGAGGPLPGLTADESAFFKDGLARSTEIEVVRGGQQWTWASLQLKPVLVLPLSAGWWRNKPRAEPFDRHCHSQWGKKRGAMVYHAKWSRA
jgi:hypothetical protein